MRVFKVYFKIIWKNLPVLSIYIIVFLLLTFLFGFSGGSSQTSAFFETKSRVMIINHDSPSPVTQGLVDYLTEKCVIVEPAKDEEGIQDALFYEDAAYILTIPQGFAEDFLSGNHELTLGKYSVPNSSAGVQLDMLVDKYLTFFNLYIRTGDTRPEDTAKLGEIASLVRSDLEKETDVIWSGATPSDSVTRLSYYLKYFSYSILSVLILGVSTIMQVFSQNDLRKRMLCAPTPATRVNLEILMGNFCFALFVWAFLTIFSIAVTNNSLSDKRVLLMAANSLVFSITALSLSFMIGYVVHKPGVQHSIANVVALGTGFLSGVFVPQELLGNTVKYIGSFTPTYWYVSAVEDIKSLTSFTGTDMKPILAGMLIQLGFAAAFLAIALVVGRQKKRKSA